MLADMEPANARFRRSIVINPPNPPGHVSNKDSMGGFGQLYPKGAPPFPPLDIPYLMAYLAERGLDATVIEAGALNLTVADVCGLLRERAGLFDTLVLVRTSLPTIDWDLQFCAEVKAAVAPGGLGLFGPVIPSLASRVEQDLSIDFAVMGEPDVTVADLMAGEPIGQVPGLMFRSAQGWTRTPDRPLERDLDSLPFPKWDVMPVERYVIPRSSVSGHARFLPMLSSRGCPFGCGYCPYPIGQGLKWRFRSPSNVVDEMQHLVRDFGVEHILFRDPMFSMQQKRVVEICEEILRRGLKVHWKCETRVDCLDAETIAIMGRAGCVGINFGVESVDPQVQKGVHRKPILVEEFVEKVALCQQHHISTFAFFVVGLPGDTLETILASIEFAVRMNADWTQFTVATPFVGTPMHGWAVEQGLVAPDFYRIVNAHTASPGNETLQPADIERLHRFATFLQNNVINRRGLLKNARRRDLPYRAAKRTVDVATQAVGLMLFRAGRSYFRHSVLPRPLVPRTPRVPV
jgi:hypothetical protein